jgi:glycine C-acetyltransferase
MFSNNMMPTTVAGTIKSIELMENNTGMVEDLQSNNRYFQDSMRASGWDLPGNPDVPIVPVMIYDDKLALDISNELFDYGIMAKGLFYPTVGKVIFYPPNFFLNFPLGQSENQGSDNEHSYKGPVGLCC